MYEGGFENFFDHLFGGSQRTALQDIRAALDRANEMPCDTMHDLVNANGAYLAVIEQCARRL
jgi:hypothetical protein